MADEAVIGQPRRGWWPASIALAFIGLIGGAGTASAAVEQPITVDVEFIGGCQQTDGFVHTGPRWRTADPVPKEDLQPVSWSPDHAIRIERWGNPRPNPDFVVTLLASDGTTVLFDMPFDVEQGPHWVARAWLDCSTTPYRLMDPILGSWLALVPLDRDAGTVAFFGFLVLASGGMLRLGRATYLAAYRWVMQP